MPANITDVDEFTDPVDIPIDTENADEASIRRFVQDLANRTRYLFNRLTGTRTVTKPDTTAGAESASTIHALGDVATASYWLLWSFTILSGGARVRMYADASRGGTLVFTHNAAWDADTATWVRDTDSANSAKLEINAPIGGSEFQRGLLFYSATTAVTAGGWQENEWSSTGGWMLGFSAIGQATFLKLYGNLDESLGPGSNELYPNSIVKAWGTVVVANGVITLISGYNINQGGCSLSGSSNLIVDFHTDMADANYCVLHGGGYAAGEKQGTVTKNTTDFQLRIVAAGGSTPVDLTANVRTFEFAVLGTQ